jgi:ribose/xylose/arabinose/galactoside ABC-type transport system permease subunit
VFLYCRAGSIGVGSDFSFSDLLTGEIIPLLPPITIITVLTVVVFAFLLNKTRFGRNVYMVGGNAETAWLAGINIDFVRITVFTISGGLAALAGILFSIAQGTAVPNMGDKGISPLLLTIAATIIGGVAMSGGTGGIIKSYFAVLSLITLFNMLSCFRMGYEAQIFAAGFVLALIVLYESVSFYFSDKIKGIRPKLLEEAAKMRKQKIERY